MEAGVNPDERCSVLIVEDDPSIAEFVESVLRDEGYEVKTATDGQGALQEVERHRPDVILLDLLLPGMGGGTFRDELRRREGAPVRIIVMTAAREPGDESIKRADGLLLKPFELTQLLGVVQRVLAGQPC
jgi:CheY-like chemotaxis protein